jgi:exodeoxyribonuclease VII large subunit
LPLDFTPRPVVERPNETSADPLPAAKPEPPRPLTVGELGRVLKRSLDGTFESAVWVVGEVTGARPATSGHLYFAFKDEHEEACVDVAIYKTNLTPNVRAMVKDGARLRLRGRPSFWAPRGRLQFVADRVEPVGRGALLEALERRKAKLAAEGLFDPKRKRRLPTEPRIIGVVTSKSGAVIHDICRVAFQRGGARVLLAPALVQGAGAPASICRAIAALGRVRGVDVIIVGRGGGTGDDLAAFDDEDVVRAVAASPVPVVSAVGHEVDVSLTDFAADARAATPSQAAELLVPDARARRQALRHTHTRLVRAVQARVRDMALRLRSSQGRLGDPRLALASYQQSKDDRASRLALALRVPIARRRDRLAALERRLTRLHPSVRLAQSAKWLSVLHARLVARGRALLGSQERTLRQLSAGLDAMSPLKVLGRGYAIVTNEEGRAVRTEADVRVGDTVLVRVATARLSASISAVTRDASPDEEPT